MILARLLRPQRAIQQQGRLVNTPELKEQRNALVLYVFGL
jgi:hypothetical protein